MPREASSQSDYALSVDGISKTFGSYKVIENLSFRVKREDIHALIGPNGAGKTTCFNLVSGFMKPDSGRITFNGSDITGMRPAELAVRGLVRSFQISAVFGSLTVIENLRVALQRQAGLHTQFWKPLSSLNCLNDRCSELLEAVGLQAYRHHRAAELSYGRKRALEIATTLALSPSIMLLDEPMAGMGREDVEKIAQLLQRLARGRTILMVEHNLAVVGQLSNRVTVLARGAVLAEGSYSEIRANEDVIGAYIGRSSHAH